METKFVKLNKIILLLISSMFFLGLTTVRAQEVLPITLDKVLELGGANNLTIKEYQERQNLAAADVLKAKEWWLPEVYGGVQTHLLWGAVMNGNGNFYLDVNRNNLWLGLGANINWDFAEGIYAAKAAKFENEASLYRTEAKKNQALLKSINAYYDLMTAQLNLVAYKNLVVQSDSIIQQIQVLVDVGLRYQSEVLLAKSNKNHLKVEMLNAQTSYNKASAVLLKHLNLDQHVKLVSVDSFLLPLDYTEKLNVVSDTLYKNRPELKANAFEIQALMVKKNTFTTGLLIPELNIGTYASSFGRINGNVTPTDAVTYPNTNQLYPTQTLNASLLWKIPLGALTFNGDKKKYNSLIRLKEIESEQIKAQINEEIASATIQLQIGKTQIEIAKEALELSAKALNQSIERQKFGTAKPFEVFQAQQFYLQSQIDYLEAVSGYNKAQFALKVAKGETL